MSGLSRRQVTQKKKLHDYKTRGCPFTKNLSKWCYAFCEPDEAGKGPCGRIAPHSLSGGRQDAIRKYNLRKFGVEKVVNLR